MKKQLLYTVLILCMFGRLCAQTFTPNETYTYSRTYLEPVTYNAINPSSNDSKKQVQSVQYTDGLGRPKQDIAIGATYGGKDLVSTYFYDPVTGRQTKQYLPVTKASTSGSLQAVSEADINTYYGVANAFAEVKTEESPLSRPLETAAPGDQWKMADGKTKKVEYLFNGLNEVKNYTAISDDDETVFYPVISSATYAANTLHKIKSTDEDGNTSYSFRNSMGQTLMTRQENGAQKLDTYYVYNQYSQLVMIIPPKASALSTLDQTAKDQLCYIYRYDAKGRLIEKKLPGKGKEEMVYDKADRLILYRDANMKTDGKWLVTKYDRFGRVLYTGFHPDIARAAIQTIIADAVITEQASSTGFTLNGMKVYYTNGWFVDMNTVLSVNYYDEYPTGSPAKPTAIPETELSSDNLADRSTKTMPTAYFVKNINDDQWTKTYYWYDQRGRSIGAQELNHLGGITTTHTELDWAGITQKVETIHKRLQSSAPVTVKERFVYSTRNYLQEHYHQVDSNPEELLAKYTYNELGQVTNKQVGGLPSSGGAGGGFLQSIDYIYNVRGWLTNINDVNTLGNKLFAYKINYTQRDGMETPNVDFPNHKVLPRYNGNITEVAWKAVDYAGATPNATPQRQGFVYDQANRITVGFYQLPGDPAIKASSEIIENYDLNGNIINLKRTGNRLKGVVKMIDNLTYNIQGNRLVSVSDASNNTGGYEGGGGIMTYDDNGNMLTMPDKGITGISYNYLNLPEVIEQTNITSYSYRADGVKTKKEFELINDLGSNTITTEYLDGFVYTTPKVETLRRALDERDPRTVAATRAGEEESFVDPGIVPDNPPTDARLQLAYFPTAEGYYDYENSRYIYQYKDHLGNVRLSYAKNPDTNELEILDRNDYYAFGMNLYEQNSVYDAAGTPLNNKYNQKELQESGFYDYGWRQYMPDLGRWFGMDKLSETYSSTSPYAYVMNNPAMMFDPDGRSTEMPDWLKTMWAMTPTGTNTNWSNTGSGSGFMNTGFSGSMSGNYTGFYSPIGSTVGYSGTGTYAFGNSGGIGGNSGGYSGGSEGYINLPTVYVSGNSSGWGKQAQAQFNAFMDVINENEAAFNEPSFTRDFAEGFRYAPESNLSAPSSWLGTLGLSMSQYEGLLTKTAKIAPIRYANISSQGLKYLKPLGKTLGLIGAGLTLYEGATDGNGLTAGDMVKVGISVVTIFTPYGWIYGAVDLGVGMATGTTLTDRIGAGIDNTILGR